MGPAFSVTDPTDQLSFFLILHLGININPRDLPKTLTDSIIAMHGDVHHGTTCFRTCQGGGRGRGDVDGGPHTF